MQRTNAVIYIMSFAQVITNIGKSIALLLLLFMLKAEKASIAYFISYFSWISSLIYMCNTCAYPILIFHNISMEFFFSFNFNKYSHPLTRWPEGYSKRLIRDYFFRRSCLQWEINNTFPNYESRDFKYYDLSIELDY